MIIQVELNELVIILAPAERAERALDESHPGHPLARVLAAAISGIEADIARQVKRLDPSQTEALMLLGIIGPEGGPANDPSDPRAAIPISEMDRAQLEAEAIHHGAGRPELVARIPEEYLREYVEAARSKGRA